MTYFPRLVAIPQVLRLLCVSMVLCGAAHGQTQPTQNPTSGGGTATTGPFFHVVRTSSGTKGIERDGRFVIEDPRAQFNPAQDRKVIVYFEWEGPVGPHKFEALWKNPTGKVVVVTDFSFAPPKSPYSGYWTMLLDESAPVGFWTVDAHIDGESAGSYSFEVVSGSVSVVVPHVRIPPSAGQVYHETDAASVFVDKLDRDGKSVMRASGFFVAPGRILTTFGIIDGASNLRVLLASGQQVTTSQVAAWNRWQDWAILDVDSTASKPLQISDRPADVGQHCYSMGISGSGARTILQVTVVGDSNHSPVGRRMSLSTAFDPISAGGPVLDEYGDVVAMLGGNLVPGMGYSSHAGESYPPLAGSNLSVSAAFAVPIAVVKIPTPGAPATSLSGLEGSGQFISLLRGQDRVSFGTFARDVDKKNGSGWPRDPQDQFSRTDTHMVLFVNWNPQNKMKGVALVRFYNADNQKVGETRPVNINVRPDSLPSTYWSVPITDFPPAIYRADVYLGDDPVWRGFFRIIQ